MLLCNDTPGPPNPAVLKTSLGAEDRVPFTYSGSLSATLQNLRNRGVSIWGLAAAATTSTATTHFLWYQTMNSFTISSEACVQSWFVIVVDRWNKLP